MTFAIMNCKYFSPHVLITNFVANNDFDTRARENNGFCAFSHVIVILLNNYLNFALIANFTIHDSII